MKRYLSLLWALLLLLPVGDAGASSARNMLTLSLPEDVLSRAITAALPLDFTGSSKSLQGNLRIIRISDLELLEQQLVCRLHLAGDHLQLVTKVADQDIRLNVGEVELDFRTRATMRFDQEKQTLYVTPIIEEVNSSKDAGGGDIGNAVLQLLHGNEFPIKLDNLDPLVTRAGSKTLTITTRIADIRSETDWLQILLDPQISADTP